MIGQSFFPTVVNLTEANYTLDTNQVPSGALFTNVGSALEAHNVIHLPDLKSDHFNGYGFTIEQISADGIECRCGSPILTVVLRGSLVSVAEEYTTQIGTIVNVVWHDTGWIYTLIVGTVDN